MSATSQHNRWGILPLLASVILTVVSLYIAVIFPYTRKPDLYDNILPILGITLSVLLLMAGHFSYPRVQNLKVYLAGYLGGLVGIVYYAVYRNAEQYENLVTWLLLSLFFNTLAILLLPSYVKYRITRRITIIFVILESAFFVAIWYYPHIMQVLTTEIRTDFNNKIFWIPILATIVIFALSIIKLKDEFYLGGIITGYSIMLAFTWITPAEYMYSKDFELIIFTAFPLFLILGILFHWISRMEHRVSYDPLLHIYNRSYCSRIISEQSNVKTVPPLGVAMIDIDHFKKVNDTYGHQAGDQILYSVAQTIQKEVVPSGILCRYGGEELIIFFPGKTSKDITPTIESVRKVIEQTKIQFKNKKIGVTVSCGISCRESKSQSIMDVIHASDKAMYRAKKGGRNQIKTGKTVSKTARKK